MKIFKDSDLSILEMIGLALVVGLIIFKIWLDGV